MTAINEWELNILHWLREHLQCDLLDTAMPLISGLADHGEIWIVAALVLLCIKKTRRTGVAMGLAMLTGLLLGNVVLKNLVGRIRPYDLAPAVELLVERLEDFAFPSGHTLVSFEAATVLTVYHRRAGIAALVLAVLIGFSRLYLFVHYPTDVLASILLGVAIALMSCRLVNSLWEKKSLRE